MHRVGHEGVTQHRYFSGCDLAPKQFEIESAVFIRKEDRMAVIPTLRHLMRDSRNHKESHPRHDHNILRGAFLFHKKCKEEQYS